MLIKKELLACLQLEAPQPKRGCQISAVAEVYEMPRCGKILAVAFFGIGFGDFYFFSDGKNYIGYIPREREWVTAMPEEIIPYYGYGGQKEDSTEADLQTVKDFFRIKEMYTKRIATVIRDFISKKNCEKRWKEADRKYERQDRHIKMCPPPPKGADKWAATLFPAYGIFENIEKGKKTRRCTCTACGKRFCISKETKHKSSGTCTKCGKELTYWRRQHIGAIKEKTEVAFAAKKNGVLTVTTETATMRIQSDSLKVAVDFTAHAWDVFPVGERLPEYVYRLIPMPYHGLDIRESKWRPNDRAYPYPYTLREAFGDTVGGVDLQALFLQNPAKVQLLNIVEKLADDERYGYLCKMGLPALADLMIKDQFVDGEKGLEAIGISNQYLSFLKKHNPNYAEYSLIRSIGRFIGEDKLQTLIDIGCAKDYGSVAYVVGELKRVSVDKFINYYGKQLIKTKKTTISQAIIWRRDYLAMLSQLGITPAKKSDLFPPNLKEAHDRLAARVKLEANKLEKQAFEKMSAELAKRVPMCVSKDYMTVLPTGNEDFIREGEVLHHCVGGGSYYKRHILGIRIIVFIRKATEPDKPFVTMEVDTVEERIIQIYGDHDKKPSGDVIAFANNFIKKLHKENKKRMQNEAQEALIAPAV